MNLTIGNTKKTKNYNNMFKLQVKDMLGDGDSYGDHITYYKPEDQWLLNFTLYFLAQGMMAYDFTYKTFHNIQDEFDEYVIKHNHNDGHGWDIMDMMYDTISSDPHSDYCASTQSVEITWIDEDGIEKEVNINSVKAETGGCRIRDHVLMVEAQIWVLINCPQLIEKTNFLPKTKEDERFKYLFEGGKMGLL